MSKTADYNALNSVLAEAENKIATMIRPSRYARGQMMT